MLIPIVCFTCGCSIGDKEDLYNHLKKEKIKEKKQPDDDVDCSKILEMLDISNDCCKMHFISNMKITDYY